MKSIFTFLLAAVAALSMSAQGVKPLPSLHVEGKWLVDTHGNHVVLHGVMDTPSMWFNSNRWSGGYNETGAKSCQAYFEKIYTAMEKAHCTVFRLHLDPAWTNDNAYTYPIAVNQPKDCTGESDIKHFNPSRLNSYLKTLYFPLMQKAMNHGMYVVVRPPGVCPGDLNANSPKNLKVGDYYQKYLMNVWDIVSKNDSVRKYAGQISLELANEPINIRNSQNVDDSKAMHDYFQPIVDLIRANGFTGIIWVPGTGYQSNYRGYKSNPITGYNIGYAVHDYPGWYDSSDEHPDPIRKRNSFLDAVPVVTTNPIIITEVDWSPLKEPKEVDHYNEFGEPSYKNLGTWATASTSKWGKAFKALLDYCGNISMTLTSTDDYIDVAKYLKDKTVTPAFDGNPEACGKACWDWYAEYYNENYPKADFTSVPISDFGRQYQNPIVRADFPDPDVIRVGDTYYMVSTTMHHFPGATILKSQDLVNWEYCAHPLKQLGSDAGYTLLNNKDAYASGMWACSMKYHNGKFHILINEKRPIDGWNLNGYLLTATNPEGEWTMKKLSRSYYDPGMLFDNGKVYVAQGIGNISVCELDENFTFKKEKKVISDKDGLEGCHFYKRGDYYYIYATYGGWPSGQALFRSKDPFGPYEEKMVVEKSYNNVPNTIHQGALVEDINGKWWTVMQEDLGALGRFPNLQPVTWTSDGWLKVGNNGVPYKSFESKIAKPSASGNVRIKRLPTTDVFRDYPIGMQWEWNHKPDNATWSLFERPGWLRLKTTNVTTKLPQARNMLTQRIFAIKNKETIGSVRIDTRGLTEGDRAGICILQDPYAAIAVEMKEGKLQLIWWNEKVKDAGSNFKAAEKIQTIELTDSIIYLRAGMKYEENKAKFYYSTDNKTWRRLGSDTSQSFNLSVFVGARFGLFCYASKKTGGYADFDWFTTEANFDENEIYPETFTPVKEDAFKSTKIALPTTQRTLETMVGTWRMPIINATYTDKHTADVAAVSSFTADVEGIVEFREGKMLGIGQGSTAVTVNYTDVLGNKQEASFTAKSSYFPFDAQYVRNDVAGTGSYIKNANYSQFKFTTKDSQQGWVYDANTDLSAYRFLVIKLYSKPAGPVYVNLYTTDKVTGACCTIPLSTTDAQTVIDLSTAVYTSTTNKGKPLDTKKIRMVTFTVETAGRVLNLKEMFLSNDSQYDVTGITETPAAPYASKVSVYNLSGQQVRSGVSRGNALEGLAPGLYIVDGRKVLVR